MIIHSLPSTPQGSHSYKTLRVASGSPWWLKNYLPMQETQVQSMGWEDTLEKEIATHSRILAQEIPWTEKPGGLQSM